MNNISEMPQKTHYRKAFNSPYLSSADIVEPTVLTVAYAKLESDKSKKTKDLFNTIHFVENEIRKGEKLKPMILNATNSKMMKELTGSYFLEDWQNIKVIVYVETGIRFGRDTVDGLRIGEPPQRRELLPNSPQWESAKEAYKRDGNLKAVLQRVDISDENKILLIKEAGA